MPHTLIQQLPNFEKKVKGENKLAIAEMFCDTIQGEGVHAGMPATFVRMQGCTLKCTWCFPSYTKILMGDFSYKNIVDVKKGDVVKTYSRQGLKDTMVLGAAQTRESTLVRVHLESGHFVDSTPDHKFKAYVSPQSPSDIRLREVPAKDLVGLYVKQVPDFSVVGLTDSVEYARGYLKGVVKGDCNVQPPYRIKLECVDQDMVIAFGKYLQQLYNYTPKQTLVQNPRLNQQNYYRLAITRKAIVSDLTQDPLEEEMRGYVAGFFDAEGHTHKSSLTMTQKTLPVLELVHDHILGTLGVPSTIASKPSWDGYELSISGQANVVKFLTHYQPAIKRKMEVAYLPSQYKQVQKVARVEELPNPSLVYSLNTSEGTYIADHIWVRNCDTLSVWPYGNEYSFDEIFEMWDKVGLVERLEQGQHLILTGGSPLKQEQRLIAFINAFIVRYQFKPFIEVENEAVLMPSQEFQDLVDWWNNSPKLANSGMKPRVRIKPEVMAHMASLENCSFKFVVSSPSDWDEIVKDYMEPFDITKDQIILMPEGQTQAELQLSRPIAAQMAIEHQVRLSDRLHVTIWDRATAV